MSPLLHRLIEQLAPEGAHPGPFAARGVDEPELRGLVAAARVAPSADNLQTWRFVAVREPARRRALAAAAPDALAPALEEAPLCLAVCGVKALIKGIRREQPFVMIDVPIALAQLLLQAAELGLRCGWSLTVDEARVRAALAIPASTRVVALLALGWPADG